MSDLLTHAQITLLAELLQADETALVGLARLGADNVEALRNGLSDAIFDSLAPTFARVSKLGQIIPNAVVIAVAEKVVPPEVAGRAAGALGLAYEDRAIAVLSGMKPAYLAEAAKHVDPRIVPHFAPKLPSHLLIPTAKELLRRRDYLTASRFVEFATDQHIVEFERAIDDDEGLIRAGAYVSRADVLDRILWVAGTARVTRMATQAALGSAELIVAMLSVLARITPSIAAPAAAVLLANPDGTVSLHILRVAADEHALGAVLQLSALLDTAHLDRFSRLPLFEDSEFRSQMRHAIETAEQQQVWNRIDDVVEARRGAPRDETG
ncbi:hypothetical protein [Mycobacteroides chelonae]|uniref:hypothetical protein n=1 Tax=Mycobacteroides chelonae TaxID=1774 RepID=UPI000B33215E|nr:hypothetical protein [Mycobacteroides chelonae]QQG86628.1 hypothetical protein HBA99_04755 [Mycobacteroides chelonae]QQG91445.1 hypothetical protein HBA97_04755 [Mycobacteroides chelonae]